MNKRYFQALALVLAGALGGFMICGSQVQSHPCGDDWNQTCRYVTVVNPISGAIEQQYVCD